MSEMWNSMAPGWDANAEFVDHHLHAATEVLLDAAGIAAGDDVLDLGSGPGGAGLAAAARVGPSGTVVLSDVAAEMIEVAARRAAASPNVSTAVFDQSEIPGPEERFDAVISRHGLMFAEDPVRAVAQAVRVLRPGGGYAAMTWGPRSENPWLGATLDAVGEQFGGGSGSRSSRARWRWLSREWSPMCETRSPSAPRAPQPRSPSATGTSS